MRFQCEHCSGIIAIDDSDLGQYVGCGHCDQPVQVPAERFGPSVVINDYIIEKLLGKGGMGVVYKAYQMSLDRTVALKIMTISSEQNQAAITDFIREARAAARVNHPNIVQAYAVGQEEGVYFLAMEMVEGMTMKQLLDANNKLPLELCLDITRQVAEALGHAWTEQKLVHRDIKPDNIMIVGDTCVAKLMDLGLSRFANDILAGNDESDEIMGTPQYISPEQLVGSAMDFRGDQYSLGATLYHCLTGEFPFNGRNAADIARKHLQDPLPPPTVHDASIPESVCRLLTKMMAKHPDDRFPDAASLAREIDTIKKNLTSSGGQVGKTGSGRIVFTAPKKQSAGKSSNGPEKEVVAHKTNQKPEAKANHRPSSKSSGSNPTASKATGMHKASAASGLRPSAARPQEQAPNWGLIGMIGMIILGIVIGAIAAMVSQG